LLQARGRLAWLGPQNSSFLEHRDTNIMGYGNRMICLPVERA